MGCVVCACVDGCAGGSVVGGIGCAGCCCCVDSAGCSDEDSKDNCAGLDNGFNTSESVCEGD